jgi:hypothetical protein
MHPTNCLNCGSHLGTGYKFCAACGQKANTHRLSLHEIGHDALHYVTHADKGIFHLIKELALRPGRVAREYVDGKRAKYFKPVNFFLIVGTLLVFMATTFHLTDETRFKQMEAAVAKVKDPVLQKKLYGIAERGRNVSHYLGKYYNVINMVATPLFALFFWLCYKKARYTYIEHLVATMFILSFSMLCYSLLLVPWQKKLTMSGISWMVMLVYFTFEITYRSFAYYHFIGRKGVGAYFKALGVSMLIVIVWAGGCYLLIDRYIRTGFQ